MLWPCINKQNQKMVLEERRRSRQRNKPVTEPYDSLLVYHNVVNLNQLLNEMYQLLHRSSICTFKGDRYIWAKKIHNNKLQSKKRTRKKNPYSPTVPSGRTLVPKYLQSRKVSIAYLFITFELKDHKHKKEDPQIQRNSHTDEKCNFKNIWFTFSGNNPNSKPDIEMHVQT